ncbi:enoyl-CoA delta isomerase 1, mitochondrial-like isoform X3 [Asterias rubens]|uniref:enoyl-CoA delta isomerase 1, mitochondrial-like isoform X3 n=1 Tax=Asterias rubens TaxID=7604 RepID=UPI001455948E|nr:enoyl-CoA delta isomerase 1, mitochondrial-like isoform X3 [Asterias rubens]
MSKTGLTVDMNPAQKLVSVERDKDMKTVAVISLNRSPTNALNRKVLHDLITILDDLEQDYSYKGAILTSSVQGVFCYGLDVAEMYQKSFDKFRDFWKALQDAWVRLYTSRLVTIAAINGLTNSSWVFEMFARVLGNRQAELSLQLGLEYTIKEAVEVGIVDREAHPKKLMDTCKEEMTRWLKIPDFSRVRTKRMIREPVALQLTGNPEGDTQNMYSYISQEVVQETLGKVLKKISNPSK